MKTTARIVLGISLLINVLLGLFLWKGPKIINFGVEDETRMRDSINVLVNERIILDRKINSLNQNNDSLIKIKNEIQISYRDKTRILYTANPAVLDSVIRNLSGIKRHR